MPPIVCNPVARLYGEATRAAALRCIGIGCTYIRREKARKTEREREKEREEHDASQDANTDSSRLVLFPLAVVLVPAGQD